MKTYYTHSDAGCFLLGNETFSFRVPNNYGDCKNKVIVFDGYDEYTVFLKKEYGESRWLDAFEWIMSLNGKFNLYNYDCSDMSSKDIKAKFDGEYKAFLRSNIYERPTLAIVRVKGA